MFIYMNKPIFVYYFVVEKTIPIVSSFIIVNTLMLITFTYLPSPKLRNIQSSQIFNFVWLICKIIYVIKSKLCKLQLFVFFKKELFIFCTFLHNLWKIQLHYCLNNSCKLWAFLFNWHINFFLTSNYTNTYTVN